MRIIPCAVLVLVVGCAPEFVRDTPELSGRLRRSSAAIAGARVSVVRLRGDSQHVSCSAPFASTTTDASGEFRASAHRALVTETAIKDGTQPGEFAICVREASDSGRVVFRAPLARWDSLRLACDLDRSWLQPNEHGMQGQCVVTRAATDEQQLARPFTTVPPAACDTTTTLITDVGIGPLKVNGSLEELRRVCPGVRDTTVEREGLFGTQIQRWSVMNVAGAPVLIRRASGAIAALEVASPVFRTRDSIGVGTRVTRLLNHPGLHVLTIVPYEEPYVFAWYGDDCGIGYSITRRAYDRREMKGTPVPLARLRAWPPSTSVRRIIVGYCPSRNPA